MPAATDNKKVLHDTIDFKEPINFENNSRTLEMTTAYSNHSNIKNAETCTVFDRSPNKFFKDECIYENRDQNLSSVSYTCPVSDDISDFSTHTDEHIYVSTDMNIIKNVFDCNISNYKELRVNLVDINKQHLMKKQKKDNIYEVEKVLGKKIVNSVSLYLIKWKNWSMSFNTWEPIENLTNCPDLLKEFENVRIKLLERFQEKTEYYPDIKQVEEYMKSIFRKGKFIDDSFADTDVLYDKIHRFFNLPSHKCKKLSNSVKERILQITLYNLRTEQLSSLEEWEIEMNSITKGKPLIRVENLVDLERAPQDFLYIDDYLPGSGVFIPEEPPIGCDCISCDSKAKCCFAQCEGSFPYTSALRIRVPPGTPIYECNKRCKCSSDCPNRVVQRGSQMKLCVFRTSNGRGWGVKTLRVIKKGTFVIQYVGEVITNEEAENRGKKYDAAGRTYLFDLDYNETEGQCPYTVDAATYGNISHFINHSCDSNLAVYAVWINCLDPNLPKLALFAKKDIKQNEELTFDYMCQSSKEVPKRHQRLTLPTQNNNDNLVENKTRCKCGAKICRQYLF